ncbi:nucleolar protein 12 [Orussus abietinus]|uniref:nucleolar protein 12 n=1 Tax=Orussus abietinus TaxID=222816 RepID=UPI000624F88A|nr:nucleolar protein 12 [Orussus abietinus]
MAKTKHQNNSTPIHKNSLKGVKNVFIGKNRSSDFKSNFKTKNSLINDSRLKNQGKNKLITQNLEDHFIFQKKVPNGIVLKNSKKVQCNQKAEPLKKTKQTTLDRKRSKIFEGNGSNDNEFADNTDVPNIFESSLPDDSDSDDDDYNGDEDGNLPKNKGVKMFKGISINTAKQKYHTSEEDDSEDEGDRCNMTLAKGCQEDALDPNSDNSVDNDDDDDDSDDNEESGPGLKDLLGNSLADDEDDEDFNSDEEDDEDTDISDEDEIESSASRKQLIHKNENKSTKDSGLGLKDLLGNSLADDDDDEDFDAAEEEDNDTDISEEEDDDSDEVDITDEDVDLDDHCISKKNQSVPKKENKLKKDEAQGNEGHKNVTPEEQKEIDKRTIYIGNLPKETTKAHLKKEFSVFGLIHSIRLRGIIPSNPGIPIKEAAIKRKIHPKINTIIAYIHFKSEESAKKAIKLNGRKFNGNFLRVDIVAKANEKPDHKKAVFLGNLPFEVEENMIWELFGDCGKIESVRIIRDSKTGIGRGYGYVNFQSVDSVALALNLDGSKVLHREIRVQPCLVQPPKSGTKRKQSQYSANKKPMKKVKKQQNNDVTLQKQATNVQKHMVQKENDSLKHQQRSPKLKKKNINTFQGQKAERKKKIRGNKGEKKKKLIAEILTKRASKKPAAN